MASKRKTRRKRDVRAITKPNSALFSRSRKPAWPATAAAVGRGHVSDPRSTRRLFYAPLTHREPIPADRRVYGYRNIALMLSGVPAEYTLSNKPPAGSRGTIARIAFKSPKRVTVCVRRKRRRESLFALGHAGKGKKILGLRKWSEFSDVKC